MERLGTQTQLPTSSPSTVPEPNKKGPAGWVGGWWVALSPLAKEFREEVPTAEMKASWQVLGSSQTAYLAPLCHIRGLLQAAGTLSFVLLTTGTALGPE